MCGAASSSSEARALALLFSFKLVTIATISITTISISPASASLSPTELGYGGDDPRDPRGPYGGMYGQGAYSGSRRIAGSPCLLASGSCDPDHRYPEPSSWYTGSSFTGVDARWCPCNLAPLDDSPVPVVDAGASCALKTSECLQSQTNTNDFSNVSEWTIALEWTSSKLAATSCAPSGLVRCTDTEGTPFGGYPLEVTTYPVCRRIASNVNGTVVVLDAFVDPVDLARIEFENEQDNFCTPDTMRLFETTVECDDRGCVNSADRVIDSSSCDAGATLYVSGSTCLTAEVVSESSDCETASTSVSFCPSLAGGPIESTVATIAPSEPSSAEIGQFDPPLDYPPLVLRIEGSECVSNESSVCGWGERLDTFRACTRDERGCSPRVNSTNPERTKCRVGPCVSSINSINSIDSELESEIDLPCGGETMDVRGTCCDAGESLDRCGLCPSTEYDAVGRFRIGLDALGMCCSGPAWGSVILTGELTCCAAGTLDACGVCGGANRSCKLSVYVPETDPEILQRAANMLRTTTGRDVNLVRSKTRRIGTRSLKQESTGEILVNPGESPFGMDDLMFALIDTLGQTWNEPSNDDPLTILPTAVEGNGRCEYGESHVNSVDCFDTLRPCPNPTPSVQGLFTGNPMAECGGRGACSRAENRCICPPGYVGVACEECDVGFSLEQESSGLASCVPTRIQEVLSSVHKIWNNLFVVPIVSSPALAWVAHRMWTKFGAPMMQSTTNTRIDTTGNSEP